MPCVRGVVVFPVEMTGLHCGVAADDTEDETPADVFPVEMTGLHCGIFGSCMLWPYRNGVFPVEMTGLHCGLEGLAGGENAMACLPGRNDRAPLRRQNWSYRSSISRSVFPVEMTGLHCGIIEHLA